MDFIFGMFFGGCCGLMFAVLLCGGSGLTSEKKEVIMDMAIFLTRYEDYLEEQERQGNIKFSETELSKDRKEFSKKLESLSKDAK